MILDVIFALFALLRKGAKSCFFLAQVTKQHVLQWFLAYFLCHFRTFAQKCMPRLFLVGISWGTQMNSGTRTSPPRGAAGSPMGSPRPRTTHAPTGVSCNRSRSGGPDRAEHSLPPHSNKSNTIAGPEN